MGSNVVSRLKSAHRGLIFLSLVLVAESITAVIVSVMSWVFHGRVGVDFLVTGAIAAFMATVGTATLTFELLDALRESDRVAAREMERAREQAEAAREAAEAANLAKSAFLANMSHEIRTPMSGIIGIARILRLEGVSPRQAERLDTIDASAQHLLGILNDLLDLAKIEAGRLELDEAPVAVGVLLDLVRSILAERAAAKGLQLVIEAEIPPCHLVGDPTRLQQALLNFATNAVKFTERGSVTLRCRVQEETDEAAILRFEVQDTGIGIAPEALPRLFSAFEQADNSITRKYGGTGLGLAITQRLAKCMGGEAGVRSVPGEGSTFWFTARLRKVSMACEVPPKPAQDARTELREHFAGACVLVVDDEPLNREVAELLLRAADLRVETAGDGAAAIDMTRNRRFRAIFMDMQMPIMDGLEATQRIRQLPDCATVPIIAMTANAFAEDRARCLAAGMNDFLAKPFYPDELFATVLRWLEQGGRD